MPSLLAVNNYFYRRGGAETVFFEHARLFENHGWDVIPFSMHHERNVASQWSRYFVDEIEFGMHYSVLQRLMRVSRVIYSLQSRRNLSRLLDKVSIDICHAHNIYHHISPSILGLLHRRRVPIVLTLHDLKIACPAYTMLADDGICERCKGGRLHNVVLHRCVKRSFALSAVVMSEAILHKVIGSYRRCVDRFIVPSRFYLNKFVEWGMPAEKLRHVPNFVSASQFRPAFEPGNRVLYFGRLVPEKGLKTLIKAASQVDCPLAIIGTGPELGALRDLARTLRVDVEFTGFLGGEELHAAVRRARAVVLPSEWYENAPMSVLESYSLGKPVIGSDIGGIPELIRDGETGYRFPAGDWRALAGMLERVKMAKDTALTEMGRAGRKWVETEFTEEKYFSRVISLYRELGIDPCRAS